MVSLSLFFPFGVGQRLFKMDKADGDEVRTKELICKLIALNQFVALAPVITKGYGQRDLDKEGLELVKRPGPTCDNITASLTLCWLKVNNCRLRSQ